MGVFGRIHIKWVSDTWMGSATKREQMIRDNVNAEKFQSHFNAALRTVSGKITRLEFAHRLPTISELDIVNAMFPQRHKEVMEEFVRMYGTGSVVANRKGTIVMSLEDWGKLLSRPMPHFVNGKAHSPTMALRIQLEKHVVPTNLNLRRGKHLDKIGGFISVACWQWDMNNRLRNLFGMMLSENHRDPANPYKLRNTFTALPQMFRLSGGDDAFAWAEMLDQPKKGAGYFTPPREAHDLIEAFDEKILKYQLMASAPGFKEPGQNSNFNRLQLEVTAVGGSKIMTHV